jgi:xanthine dehydrogenase accessory factor
MAANATSMAETSRRHAMNDQGTLVLPRDTGLDPDDPASVFSLLLEGAREGLAGALITIIDINGGAPRALGAQMAVLEDGRFCGYVSGGCVEAAVAGEAIRCIGAGADEVLRFGVGSPFIDIKLPCGGSIDVHVQVRPDPRMLAEAQRMLELRAPFCVAFRPTDGASTLVPGSAPRERSEWRDGVFYRHYHPLTQLVLIGEGHELVALAQVGRAAGLPVTSFMTAEAHAQIVAGTGSPVVPVNGAELPELPVDPFTAIVFLLHDRFKENRLLESALGYDPFYIGALGSRRTHATRVARLEAAGVSEERIARLHGPVGLYGPTRTSSALAISVLGEITEARIRLDG